MPEPLADVLPQIAAVLADTDQLIRAVASGRQRGHDAPQRAQLRPVALARGVGLQVVRGEHPPVTATHRTVEGARAAVAALVAEPFGNWHLETTSEIIQVRVTKRGDAQVHRQATSRRQNIAPSGHDRVKQRLIDPDDPLFTVLGAGADKRRQVDAFLRVSERALDGVLRRRAGQQVTMIDIGCGNAYLTCALHRFVSDRHDGRVRTIGIEQRADLVARSAQIAEDAGLVGLEFCAVDAAAADPAQWTARPDADAVGGATGVVTPLSGLPEWEPRTSDGQDDRVATAAFVAGDEDSGATDTEDVEGAGGVDVVVALHACDTATDDALALAVRWRAAVILAAPCCHKDAQRQIRSYQGRSPRGRVQHGDGRGGKGSTHLREVSDRSASLDAVPSAGGAGAGAERHPGAPTVTMPPPGYAAVVGHAILRERWADVLTDAVRAELLGQVGYRVDVVEFVDSRHTPRNALIRAVFDPACASVEGTTVAVPELAAQWGVVPALWERLRTQ